MSRLKLLAVFRKRTLIAMLTSSEMLVTRRRKKTGTSSCAICTVSINGDCVSIEI